MRFSVYQISRKGGREKNEDRMGYCYTRDSGLFALADGMGGHPEGEVASQLALQTLAAQSDYLPRLRSPQRVRLLWEICQVPDFRKTMTEVRIWNMFLMWLNRWQKTHLLTNW